MAKRQKTNSLRKEKLFIWVTILLSFLFLLFVYLRLEDHLYDIQRTERLAKVEDYTSFQITVRPQKRSTKRLMFQDGDNSYYFDGLDQVYIHYGSTVFYLQDIIQSDYFELEDILLHCTLVSSNEIEKNYQHESKDENKRYHILVEQLENTLAITFSL